MTTPAVPEIAVEDPDQMRALGARLAPLLRAGDLIILDGPLGAGKTVFVQGLAAGLGVCSPVTSPTFVLARVHTDGRLPLVHVDAYRLGGAAEVDDLDLDADLGRSVCAVEWGSGLVEQMAAAHLRVEISRPSGDETGDVRRVRLRPAGADWAARLTALATPDRTPHPQGPAAR
ncbi:tRNA (N6-adenosine(37)-N6)-threonylcarbamoyltransferase complex ATPase TsaE [Parafrankia soli]|uniref:tRNA threonylcarbamoyladenosine biosynthesis protein TsaE n=1 Tax=Parafrankia soli TaxID=2599596 RepID=A0A1S1PM83_9ACTN|nr:tRNA (adenosine(37)-N6)-threonylcarbamoyltransferase complex ATPase subunit type 1 TsaE [Parafrankia soli]OHV22486.1 tRNA (N6-adenosine(37)-N6)-threonylcarbamoyltransferase complex ATPase TsaE [Parafrankia soli]CAI7975710.1 tRNA threonylcarbamoyladenosine biosynthesis protein TsaE [Frankia sp. Hr75.2]